MKCPVCHQGEMVSGIKDIPYTFRGRKTVLKKNLRKARKQ